MYVSKSIKKDNIIINDKEGKYSAHVVEVQGLFGYTHEVSIYKEITLFKFIKYYKKIFTTETLTVDKDKFYSFYSDIANFERYVKRAFTRYFEEIESESKTEESINELQGWDGKINL